jgi:peptidoglycan/xylan/chitin deacetylase (PgdA/CDA1 family)
MKNNNLLLTFDDFPLAFKYPRTWKKDGIYKLIIKALSKKEIKGVVGFFNGEILEKNPEIEYLIKDWANRNFYIGNHTYSHLGLHQVNIETFIEDVLKNQEVLNTLCPSHAMLNKLRFPYLEEGRTLAEWNEIIFRLKLINLSPSLCSINIPDYLWNDIFIDAIEKNDRHELEKVKAAFFNSINDKVKHTLLMTNNEIYRSVSHVAVMHFCSVTAFYLEEIIDYLGAMGFEFIGHNQLVDNNFNTFDYQKMRINKK